MSETKTSSSGKGVLLFSLLLAIILGLVFVVDHNTGGTLLSGMQSSFKEVRQNKLNKEVKQIYQGILKGAPGKEAMAVKQQIKVLLQSKDALSERVVAKLKNGKQEAAIELLRPLLTNEETNTTNVNVALQVAALLFYSDTAEAQQILEKATGQFPEHFVVADLYGHTLISLKHIYIARHIFRQNLDIIPDDNIDLKLRTLSHLIELSMETSGINDAVNYAKQALAFSQDINASSTTIRTYQEQLIDTYLQVGEKALNAGHLRRGDEMGKLALALAQEIDDVIRQGETYYLLGSIFGEAKYHDLALEHYSNGLIVLDERAALSLKSKIQLGIGNIYLNSNRPKQAIDYFQKALASIRQTKDARYEGKALGNIGVAYHRLNQLIEANYYYETAIAVLKDISPQEAALLQHNLTNLTSNR